MKLILETEVHDICPVVSGRDCCRCTAIPPDQVGADHAIPCLSTWDGMDGSLEQARRASAQTGEEIRECECGRFYRAEPCETCLEHLIREEEADRREASAREAELVQVA